MTFQPNKNAWTEEPVQSLADYRGSKAQVRLLIAEDNEIGLEVTRMMARKLGVAADGAADGQQALSMIIEASMENRPYSLVLMDFMMPIIGGIEATRRARRAGFSAESLPIIALTAVAEPRELKLFDHAGGQGYLPKPLTLERLSAVLTAWLPERTYREALPGSGNSAALHQRYLARHCALLDRIDEAISTEDHDFVTLAEILDMLHKLAGTAGMFGDDALSAAAAECESRLNTVQGTEAIELLALYRPRLDNGPRKKGESGP